MEVRVRVRVNVSLSERHVHAHERHGLGLGLELALYESIPLFRFRFKPNPNPNPIRVSDLKKSQSKGRMYKLTGQWCFMPLSLCKWRGDGEEGSSFKTRGDWIIMGHLWAFDFRTKALRQRFRLS